MPEELPILLFSDRGVFWIVIEAIDDTIALGFPANDLDRLEKLLKDFYDHSDSTLDDSVLAVDGFGEQT